mgnify:CR=1 FL=1|jgi:hypothetical protein
MIQSTINDWINNKNLTKLYFCLEWKGKTPLKNAYWSYTKPDNMNIFKHLNLKSIGNVYVVGNLDNNNTELKLGVKTITNTSLLISNLQKCIRRGYYDLAIQSAIHILANNPILLFRRLPIIMLEDCYPHITINTIVWMMVTYGKWFPTLCHIKWLLGVIKMICLNPLHLEPYKKDKLSFDLNTNIEYYVDDLFIDDISIVLSIIIRSEYGGLESDMKMLYWYITKIINIFNNNKYKNISYSNVKVIPIRLKLVNIKNTHILNEAVDFHCFPNIIDYIIKKTNNKFNKIYIKQIIWEYLSSENYRNKFNKNPTGNEHIILNYARMYSKKKLDYIFNNLNDSSVDNNIESDDIESDVE